MKNRWWMVVALWGALAGCESELDAQLRRESLINEQRIDTLKRGNDSLSREREVVFWARFRAPADLPCFDTWLSAHGYTVQYKSERKQDAYPHVVEFTRSLIPTLDTMNAETRTLVASAAACNGVYQEWEAPVVP